MLKTLLLVVLCLIACPRESHLLTTEPDLALRGEVLRPKGDGPFPAVLILHGCGGVTYAEEMWAKALVGMGYVALLVDSFGPRGLSEICSNLTSVSREERAQDAQRALRWLSSQAYIDPARIGLLGLSNGGYTLLGVLSAPAKEPHPFAAAVALYPECAFEKEPVFSAPLLILIGGADDWTLASSCKEMASAARGAPATIKVYPKAHHSFDDPTIGYFYYGAAQNPNKPGGCCGATLAYNKDAARDAREQVKTFFGEHLGSSR